MDALMTTNDGYIHPFWWFFMPNAAHLALKSKVDNCSLDRLGVLQRDGLAVDWRWIGMFMPICSWSQFQWSIWGWRSIGFCLEKHYQSIEFCFVLIFLMFFFEMLMLRYPDRVYIIKHVIQLGVAGMSAMLHPVQSNYAVGWWQLLVLPQSLCAEDGQYCFGKKLVNWCSIWFIQIRSYLVLQDMRLLSWL